MLKVSSVHQLLAYFYSCAINTDIMSHYCKCVSKYFCNFMTATISGVETDLRQTHCQHQTRTNQVFWPTWNVECESCCLHVQCDFNNTDVINETVSCWLWCGLLLCLVKTPFSAVWSLEMETGDFLEVKITHFFLGSSPYASCHSGIPDLHFWECSDFSSFPSELQAHRACLAGGAGTSPEGALTWIIQQLVWKMIVFGSVIDMPPEERRIYSLGAAGAERVWFEKDLFCLKMINMTEFIRRSKLSNLFLGTNTPNNAKKRIQQQR